jgi:hypothetical protein
MASVEVTENNLAHFAKVAATDNNMTVVIEDVAWDMLPTESSEVAAYDRLGKLIGSARYTSPVTVLTVWGDDATTLSKDGMALTEPVLFKIWTAGMTLDFEVSDWKVGSSAYAIDVINVAGSITTSNEQAALNLFKVIPNPVSTIATISFYIPETSVVNLIVYNVLGEVVEVLTEARYNEGFHSVLMDTETLKAGTYYYQLNSNKFTSTKCLSVLK